MEQKGGWWDPCPMAQPPLRGLSLPQAHGAGKIARDGDEEGHLRAPMGRSSSPFITCSWLS